VVTKLASYKVVPTDAFLVYGEGIIWTSRMVGCVGGRELRIGNGPVEEVAL
jgi:hypothetical protein